MVSEKQNGLRFRNVHVSIGTQNASSRGVHTHSDHIASLLSLLINVIGNFILHFLAIVGNQNPTISSILFLLQQSFLPPNLQVVKCEGQRVKTVYLQFHGYLIALLPSEPTCLISQVPSFRISKVIPRPSCPARFRKGLFRKQGLIPDILSFLFLWAK